MKGMIILEREKYVYDFFKYLNRWSGEKWLNVFFVYLMKIVSYSRLVCLGGKLFYFFINYVIFCLVIVDILLIFIMLLISYFVGFRKRRELCCELL